MPFSEVCGFLRIRLKMVAYEELITPIYTLFCQFQSIGKTTMGYKILFELIKTVCALNTSRFRRNFFAIFTEPEGDFWEYIFCPFDIGVIIVWL